MIVKSSLSKEDYLTHQLFVASHSKNIQNSRMRLRVFVPIAWLILGVWISYREGSLVQITVFSIFSVVWYMTAPMFDKWQYKKHYAKHIDEHYTKRLEQENIIDFQEDWILASSEEGEGKIKYDALLTLHELKEYYFLSLSSGSSFIVPKKDVEDGDRFKFELTKKTGLSWENHLDWAWK
ncbi:MAG TPA: hypothetical protein EYG95_03250 [Campylobacterales bacterium]|nr:hypothetical protein [Campylobacterales bacterium]